MNLALDARSVPGTVPGTGETAVNQTDPAQIPNSEEVTF